MVNSKAKILALIAVMATLLEVGKFSLNAVANVEVVTLFCALFGYTFGFISVVSVAIFVFLEIAIFGFAPWVISYLVHFSFVVVVFGLFKKFNMSKVWVMCLSIVLITACFGLLTSFVDIAFSGFNNFWYRYWIYYGRGMSFYAVHIVSNAVIFILLFLPLEKLLQRIKQKFIT
ncbi:MAG: hypothetical protein ACI4M6_04720 [Christensenellaceae bacterium]